MHDPREPHDDEPDEPEAAAGARGVPHPMDRLWRHPSEMGAGRPGGRRSASPSARRAGTSPAAAPRARRSWPTAVAGAAVGSLVTVGILAATGALTHDHTDTVTITRRFDSQSDTALQKAASVVQPAVVAVVARDAKGARRGSGVCVRHGTDIVTAAAVVGAAKQVTVVDSHGAIQTGIVRGRDTAAGLALVEVNAQVSAAPLAAQAPATGESVFVVGHDGFVDVGIVTEHDLWVTDGSLTMRGLLGTNITGDGTTGGALVDRNGVVAGIVVDPNGVVVPMSYAEQVVDRLRRDGTVAHGWIGISGADHSGIATVMAVERNSPAAGAGLAPGDVITGADGHAVLGMAEVVVAIRSHWPGETIVLTVTRGHASHVVRVSIAAPPVGAEPSTSHTFRS